MALLLKMGFSFFSCAADGEPEAHDLGAAQAEIARLRAALAAEQSTNRRLLEELGLAKRQATAAAAEARAVTAAKTANALTAALRQVICSAMYNAIQCTMQYNAMQCHVQCSASDELAIQRCSALCKRQTDKQASAI